MHNDLGIIGRSTGLFDIDIGVYENQLREIVSSSRFLIIGAAGSIG